MRGERVRHSRRDDQQVAGPRGDDVVADQQVERAAEDVEELGGVVVAMRQGAIRAAAEDDPVAGQRAAGGAAVGQQDVPDQVEVLGLVRAHQHRRVRAIGY